MPGVDIEGERTLESFLAGVELFRRLSFEEREALAELCEEFAFDQGGIVAYQRDVADGLYIVRTGYLYARRVDDQGVVRDARQYMPGEYFEDIWLFEPRTHTAMVRGGEDGRLIFIQHELFMDYLADFPQVIDKLELTVEADREADGSQYVETGRDVETLGLLADEIIEFHERRSRYLLLLRVTWPLIGALIWLALVALTMGIDNTPGMVVAFFPAAIFILYALLQYFDWTNDYFVISNKHLVHREYNLRRFRGTVNKTPIDQIQSVEVEKPSLLATLLNTGTVRVTTAAQAGVIRFDFIDEPDQVKEILNRLRELARTMDEGRTQASMREAIERHFQAPPTYRKVEEPAGGDSEIEEEVDPTTLSLLLDRLRRGISARVEDGDIITYRKHIFTLFRKSWVQILVGLFLISAMVVAIQFERFVIVLIPLALALIDLAWFIWKFEDWRNDTFQVTDRYVIDIDRRPFGFGESRKQAELGNVQNVNADKPGFLATIFNYGNVIIETAGATADITFERVVNPNRIQSDIFHRRELYREKQRAGEGEGRRREYAVLLDVYQQAQEQGRLPRRTPPAPQNPPDDN